MPVFAPCIPSLPVSPPHPSSPHPVSPPHPSPLPTRVPSLLEAGLPSGFQVGSVTQGNWHQRKPRGVRAWVSVPCHLTTVSGTSCQRLCHLPI